MPTLNCSTTREEIRTSDNNLFPFNSIYLFPCGEKKPQQQQEPKTMLKCEKAENIFSIVDTRSKEVF